MTKLLIILGIIIAILLVLSIRTNALMSVGDCVNVKALNMHLDGMSAHDKWQAFAEGCRPNQE